MFRRAVLLSRMFLGVERHYPWSLAIPKTKYFSIGADLMQADAMQDLQQETRPFEKYDLKFTKSLYLRVTNDGMVPAVAAILSVFLLELVAAILSVLCVGRRTGRRKCRWFRGLLCADHFGRAPFLRPQRAQTNPGPAFHHRSYREHGAGRRSH